MEEKQLMSNETVLYSNDNYEINIGDSIHDESSVPCYQIINKETKVVEAESTVYPTAIGYANQFSTGLNEVNAPAIPKVDFQH